MFIANNHFRFTCAKRKILSNFKTSQNSMTMIFTKFSAAIVKNSEIYLEIYFNFLENALDQT